MTEEAKRWRRVGNGYRCEPFDIGSYMIDGTTLWVLWHSGQCQPVGHFEDLADAMARAKELSEQEKGK